jgi:NADH dehydrogenase [ubiquinone] 1 alpha subcomplex assembly factor 7
MTALADRLRERIRQAGSISVADYMEEAGAFYYATRDPFGAAGDFITAPEVSQIFGELIGLWCAELWRKLGAPDPVLLVELGPGRGTLMADALRAVQIVPAFARAVKLHLVERSPVLRQMQGQKLGAAAPQWHDSIATLPPGPMLLIANEFLDALPIRQFERRGGLWYERRVALGEDGTSLAFVRDKEPSALAAPLPAAADGAIAELSPVAGALGAATGARLAAQGGAALFIDYGYFPSACGDTLQALRRHQRHAVLDEPGSADLTAHVDFAAFAAAARASGAEIFGPVTQRAFLRHLGLEARRDALLKNATPAQAQAIESGVHRLIDPTEMGSLFKVLALTQPGAPVPAGFNGEIS